MEKSTKELTKEFIEQGIFNLLNNHLIEPNEKEQRMNIYKLAAEALFYLEGNNVNVTNYSFPTQSTPDYQRRNAPSSISFRLYSSNCL